MPPAPPLTDRPLVVGLGGTTRPGSTSERAVRAVLATCEALGARTLMFDGPTLAALPHFAPDHPSRDSGQAALVAAVRDASALVIGTPAYHAGVSGLVKNAVDLLEDLRDDPRPYLDGRAVGLVTVASGWQAGGVVLSALRDIVHSLRGWPTPMGVTLNTSAGALFDAQGACLDAEAARGLALVAQQLTDFGRRREPAA